MTVEDRQWHYQKGYEDGRADALSIDMEKPMHFTDEQKAWIKQYIIINAKRQRADAIDEFLERFIELLSKGDVDIEEMRLLAEQIKEQNNG